MRPLYSLLLYFLIPAVIARLLWRSRRAPAYRRRWAERFGYIAPLPMEDVVWVHAVSVGETVAAAPLIQWLLARGEAVLVTSMTPTGSERVRALFGERVQHVYCPYDLPGAVRRFLRRTRPKLALIMETELWPNLFYGCAQARVPLIVANARLSERSARGYRRFATLARATLTHVNLVAAQTEADATRLRGLGARAVRVTGNIKFDMHLPASLIEQAAVLRRGWGEDRLVWVAASTHAGEDEQVLTAFAQVRHALPTCLLVLVPRHPERFDEVAALCQQRGFAVARRSEQSQCEARNAVFLIDRMGELPLFYAAGDLAFVGGSLVPTGGHNVLEPAALGKPVIVGPHSFNFLDITRQLVEAGAALRVADAAQLAEAALRYLADANLRDTAGRKGRALVEQNRGALARLQDLLEDYLAR